MVKLEPPSAAKNKSASYSMASSKRRAIGRQGGHVQLCFALICYDEGKPM